MKVIKWGLISIAVILCGSSLIIGVSNFIFLDSLSDEKAPQIVQSVGTQAAHSQVATPLDPPGKEQALVSEQNFSRDAFFYGKDFKSPGTFKA